MGDRMNSIKIGKLTISLVMVKGRKTYELWHDDKPKAIGRYDSFSEAKDAAKREESRENNPAEND